MVRRVLMRTAAIVICSAWAAGCSMFGGTDRPDATAQAAPAASAPPTQDFSQTLDSEITRAHLLREQGNYAEAAQALAQMMLVVPDDPRVVGEYGKVLAQQGRPEDALPFLTRAIELQPNDWSLYSAQGVAYDQTNNHEAARAAYEHALALKPGAADVLNNYAVSRMLAGDLAGAQRLLAQASSHAPVGVSEAKITNNLELLASMRGTAAPAAAPAPAAQIAQQSRPPKVEQAALAAPHPLGHVVMQKVPFDPYAGPVAASKLAKATSHAKTTLAQKSPKTPKHATPMLASRPPMLRTAADNE